MMQVTAFNGSPAGKNSATEQIISALMRGAARAGAHTKTYQLAEYHIEQCKGCFACWFRTPGGCVLQDDMRELLESYMAADIVCFASPVYSWNMTALLKNFVDRLIPLKCPRMTEQDGHFDMADAVHREQRYVAISNCGFPGENNFSVIKAAFSCCAPCLEIYRNCGKVLVSSNPSVRKRAEPFLTAVEQAGYELTANGCVCADTQARIAAPIMETGEYARFLGMA